MVNEPEAREAAADEEQLTAPVEREADRASHTGRRRHEHRALAGPQVAAIHRTADESADVEGVPVSDLYAFRLEAGR